MHPKVNFLPRNQKDILRARHRHERDKRLCNVEEETPSSAKQVIHFAKNHFGASYMPLAMVSLLHRLKFIYKKPKLIPGKVNEAAKELFFQELQKLEKELAQIDQLLYLGGVHPQHNSKPSYGQDFLMKKICNSTN